MKKKSKPQRLDEDFIKDMDDIINLRIGKGLDKRNELSFREVTRIMRTGENYPKLLYELKTKPRRKR